MRNSVDIGRLIKRARENKKIRQIDFAERLGIHKSTLSKYESGQRKIPMDDIAEMANALEMDVRELLLERKPDEGVKELNIHTIPVVASVSAGLPIYEETDIIDTTYITDTIYKEGKEFFGLKVSGNSMDKEFKDGDIVIVEKDAPIEDGQIGVVQVNGYESTLKRVRYNDDTIILMPESNDPSHQPQFYDKDDEVYLIGRVVGLNRSY